ncbi:hypothetical protein D3C76_824870 [compost metagenome]
MAGIERHARHIDAIDHFTLYELDLVSRVQLTARVIGEAGNDFHFKTLSNQFTGKYQPLERWLRVKPLSEQ